MFEFTQLQMIQLTIVMQIMLVIYGFTEILSKKTSDTLKVFWTVLTIINCMMVAPLLVHLLGMLVV